MGTSPNPSPHRAKALQIGTREPARQAGGHWFEPSTAHLRRCCANRCRNPIGRDDPAAVVHADLCDEQAGEGGRVRLCVQAFEEVAVPADETAVGGVGEDQLKGVRRRVSLARSGCALRRAGVRSRSCRACPRRRALGSAELGETRLRRRSEISPERARCNRGAAQVPPSTPQRLFPSLERLSHEGQAGE